MTLVTGHSSGSTNFTLIAANEHAPWRTLPSFLVTGSFLTLLEPDSDLGIGEGQEVVSGNTLEHSVIRKDVMC